MEFEWKLIETAGCATPVAIGKSGKFSIYGSRALDCLAGKSWIVEPLLLSVDGVIE
ncbi:MAG: hypothetical protein IPJ30_12650 [Acidobacteria bacterium]|nr:hypothetical protein [Acidobacteriota bacterium]